MTRFLTTTRVNSSNVVRCIVGHFHESTDSFILWGYSDRLELYREAPHGRLLLVHKQHTHDKVLELGYLRGQPNGLHQEACVSAGILTSKFRAGLSLLRQGGYHINI